MTMRIHLCASYFFDLLNQERNRLIVRISAFTVLLILLLQLRWHLTTDSNTSKQQVQISAGKSYQSILPSSVVDNVQVFLFFIGYALSGQSIMASMLDSHPNIVLAHEYSLFSKCITYPKKHSDKHWLFNTLMENSRSNTLLGLKSKKFNKSGYTLSVPRGWQGKYDNHVYAIGDKADGFTAQMYRKNQSLFQHTYQELQRAIGIPIYVVHVIGNPFDDIAAMLLESTIGKHHVNVTRIYKSELYVKEQVINYFRQVKSVVDMIKNVPLNVVPIHMEDIISKPKNTMQRICRLLCVECSSAYLTLSANSVFTLQSRSRDLIHWSDENKKLIQYNIQDFYFLRRYIHSF